MRLGLMINQLYRYARAPRKKKGAFDKMQFLQFNNILHYIKMYNNCRKWKKKQRLAANHIILMSLRNFVIGVVHR